MDAKSMAEADFDQFFRLSLDCMAVAGFDGYLKRTNAAWTTTLGWMPEELKARPSIEFVHPDDRAATLAARARLIEGVPLLGLQNRYLCKDGTYRWLEWKSVSYPSRGFVFAVARDVTAQRAADEERQRVHTELMVAERMASIGRLAAGVAHEINNPLAFVMANLGQVLKELRAPIGGASSHREMEEMVVESLEGAERMRRTILGLKTFTRAGPERRRLLDLRVVLELALNLIGGQLRRHARLVEEYGASPAVEADEAQLGEVFANLLLQCAEALPVGALDGNELRITTRTNDAGRAVVAIRVTGTQRAPALVGLTHCREIVSGLGGELTVTREPGHSSWVEVVLPAAVTR